MKKYKSKIYGAIGSVLTMLLLFLLLWFIYIDRAYLQEDEGIMVSFGDSDIGGGQPTEESIASMPQQTVAPPPQPANASDNDLLTQEDEQSLILKKQREQEKQRKAEEAERIRKEKEQQARLETERIAKEKALAEQKAKEQAAIDKANQLGSLFSGQGNNQGSAGTEGSNTVKGNPLGHGTSGGNSWSLTGRNLNGSLATPQYNSNQEGKVVVEIRVNSSGRVIDAKATSGTTISDKDIRRAAEDAARRAVFSAGEGDVIGNITYVFKLK